MTRAVPREPRLRQPFPVTLSIVACVAGLFALLMLALEGVASPVLLWSMVVAQGLLGNGAAAIFGAIPAEIFQGRRFPGIFAMITVIANFGAACGVWALGWIRDVEGGYATGWWLCLGLSIFAAFAVWMAAPRKVRLVAGMAKRRAAAQATG